MAKKLEENLGKEATRRTNTERSRPYTEGGERKMNGYDRALIEYEVRTGLRRPGRFAYPHRVQTPGMGGTAGHW